MNFQISQNPKSMSILLLEFSGFCLEGILWKTWVRRWESFSSIAKVIVLRRQNLPPFLTSLWQRVNLGLSTSEVTLAASARSCRNPESPKAQRSAHLGADLTNGIAPKSNPWTTKDPRVVSNTEQDTKMQGPRPRKKSSFFTKVTECFSGYFDLIPTLAGALSWARQH